MTDWPDNADYDRGMDLMQLQRWADAEPLLWAAADAQPDRPRIHANLARALEHQDRLDEALEAAEAGTRLGPDDDYTWWALALIRLTRDEYEAGWQAAQEAIRRARTGSDRARAFETAARTSMLLGFERRGLAEAVEATHADPDDADTWHVRAIALAKRGRWGDGARILAEALARDPDNADYQGTRVTIELGIATLERLLPEVRERAVVEDDSDAWQALAELQFRLGARDEALAAFDTARARDPDAPLDAAQMLSPWEADARLSLLES